LQFYTNGIHNPTDCSNDINHAVLIVGYGEDDGVLYWIVKNQWGPSWGEKGFFRIIRNKKQCGIHTYASIADVEWWKF